MTHVHLRTVILAAVAALAASCLIPRKPTECSTDGDCREEYGGTYYCADDGVCDRYTKKELLAPPCDFDTQGPVMDPSTHRIGVLAGLTSVGSDELTEPTKLAAELAIKDLNVGLPSSGFEGGQFGAIFCDTQGSEERAIKAARHLADIGVDAVVGPDTSLTTLAAAEEVLIPEEMLSVSYAATSIRVTNLPDDDLVWQTVPDDSIQGQVLANLVEEIGRKKSNGAYGGLYQDRDKPVYGMSTRSEGPYATGLRENVISNLENVSVDGNRFVSATHPNPNTVDRPIDEIDYVSPLDEVVSKNPDVMMVWGIDEIWHVVRNVQNDSDFKNENTIFVMPDGGKDTEAAENGIDEPSKFAGRVWGTSPASLPDQQGYGPVENFFQRWTNQYDDSKWPDPAEAAFLPNAYDATFLIGYAAFAADAFEGPALAEAIPKLTADSGDDEESPPKRVETSQNEVSKALNELTSGNKIALYGTTGPIAFDDNGAPTNATYELWCYQSDEDSGVITGGEDPTGESEDSLLRRADEGNKGSFRFRECDFPGDSSSE